MTLTPCNGSAEPDAWTSDDPAVRKLAARACLWCPVRLECLREAARQKARAHVWGGLDLGDYRQRRIADRLVEMGEVS